ncbi:carbohydrate ABC transporter substrate-binding protein, CUT1 family [Sanguibacter gelidistatuariae]|uniref:Carbohydrate ABC transporter substrate-binding protein, CUT1 family n=1 Tax=Sanguibacter gelidistatuariae TaxID=1814289 RepID=A0A1G6Q4Y3_9MICO|nr:extracellular solute-binding protein [Sanguibacter gelidistatuariae]SDC87520.1 carbohydrate ABC transporter substrate-binding protein, CUT1 family [Sanguibacter gelidistatuariae]
MFHKKMMLTVAMTAVGALALAACGGGSDDSNGASSESASTINVLIGSSGDAETKAVTDAVAAWSTESGVKAKVSVASDIAQQLSQGFASGNPADVFYLTNDTIATYASNGSLDPFVEGLSNKDDFYPTIMDSFTYDGQVYAAPKDFSTLALIINSDKWAAAGLTDADIPTSWDELSTVAAKLTTGDTVGLSISPEFARVGAFFAQNGGWLVDDKGAVTADSPENVEALTYVQSLLTSGSMKYASEVGAGWGGEAFGTGAAAMTIEGNWITGALTNTYPDVKYTVAELPAGPAGKGTMQFNGGWGIAADSQNKDNATKLVEYLTQPTQQLTFATDFGVMPAVVSTADQWKTDNPALAPFIEGADYAKSIPNIVGIKDVIDELNSQIQSLSTGDPKTILESTQTNLESISK